ncbi:hypothetical protein [Streptomyces sp. LN699]|uniref:hypothetical protein n=1 Tax=Streptomyces sp. LN699 TaxID=3112981 RepID=UPI003715BF94
MEVDNGTESPPILAEKIARYRRFFARSVPRPGGPRWGVMSRCGARCGRRRRRSTGRCIRRWRSCSRRTWRWARWRPACGRSSV